MDKEQKFDTIVLGLGAMGSATLYQLAKKGNKVLGIDQFSPPHTFGSSHGDTRITRQAIGEGEQYTPFAMRSHELWKEIEKETGRKLMINTGGLVISSSAITAVNHVEDFFDNTVTAAEKFKIKHDTLTTEEIRKRFPQFKIQDDEIGYFEHDAGYLRPEECIRAELELAQKYGAVIHTEEKVLEYFSDEKVKVKTNKGEYTADKLIITAGPWLPELIEEEYAKYFKILRQVLFWFDVEESFNNYTPDKFPIFILELPADKKAIYGFPAIDGPKGGIKIATEQYGITTTIKNVKRDVGEQEIKEMYENFVAPYLSGVSSKCIKAVSCLYTVTPDSGFLIDFHPKHKNIIIASPCSGHGFKHSAAIGEALSEIVTEGKSHLDLSAFSLSRFKDININ